MQEFASNALSLSQKDAVNHSGVSFVMAVAELAEVFAETAFVHGYICDLFARANFENTHKRAPEHPQDMCTTTCIRATCWSDRSRVVVCC